MSDLQPLGQNYKKFQTDFAGKNLTIETGDLAFRADRSVRVTVGETVVMANVVVGREPRMGVDFFPLMVDYEEIFYASGKISSSRFIKREGRPSEKAILTSRLIDRPIRPLFPKGFYNDVQVVITVLSTDLENEPDILAIIAASTALHLAGLPFSGPVAAARVGVIDRKLVINPLASEMRNSRMNLVVAGTADAIMMVEAGAQQVQEATIIKAFELALASWQNVINLQNQIKEELEIVDRDYKLAGVNNEAYLVIKDYLADKLGDAVRNLDRESYHQTIEDLRKQVIEKFGPNEDLLKLENEAIKLGSVGKVDRYEVAEIEECFDKIIDAEIRRSILKEGIRPDGRTCTEIRPIWCQAGILPRPHGSAVFTRGATQALTITTLASTAQAQVLETMDQDLEKHYFHHYNFPPYSVGEAKPLRSPGRREIGHGALAERALEAVIPSVEDFPYTIRTVSEIMSSSGSTSMASVCGSTLSLMDAGVPIKANISGIAMGLMVDHENPDNYQILSDIQDAEDFAGDMDFKVAGSRSGITALQMDIKVKGLSLEILEKALMQAKAGRLEILEIMEETIKEPRLSLSKYAPKSLSFRINPEKIRLVIGKGGETIQKIISKFDIEIDIKDDGVIYLTGINGDNLTAAKEHINLIVAEPEIGKIYAATVVNVTDFGAFVEFMPGTEGLVHISMWDNQRIDEMAKVAKPGDQIQVKLLEIDSSGRFKLSRKDAL